MHLSTFPMPICHMQVDAAALVGTGQAASSNLTNATMHRSQPGVEIKPIDRKFNLFDKASPSQSKHYHENP